MFSCKNDTTDQLIWCGPQTTVATNQRILLNIIETFSTITILLLSTVEMDEELYLIYTYRSIWEFDMNMWILRKQTPHFEQSQLNLTPEN